MRYKGVLNLYNFFFHSLSYRSENTRFEYFACLNRRRLYFIVHISLYSFLMEYCTPRIVHYQQAGDGRVTRAQKRKSLATLSLSRAAAYSPAVVADRKRFLVVKLPVTLFKKLKIVFL